MEDFLPDYDKRLAISIERIEVIRGRRFTRDERVVFEYGFIEGETSGIEATSTAARTLILAEKHIT